jgi:hypothetical protein
VRSEFRTWTTSPLLLAERVRLIFRLRATSTAVVLLCAAPAVICAQTRVEVSNNISDCPNFRTRQDTSARRRDCLAPRTQGDVVTSVPYWLKIGVANSTTHRASKRYLVNVQPVAPAQPTLSPAAPAPSPAAVGNTANAWLEVHVVDVGQGDAIWIRTPDEGISGNRIFEGKNIVIDGELDANDANNEMLHYLDALYQDGDHIVVRTNGTVVQVQAYADSQPMPNPTSCAT